MPIETTVRPVAIAFPALPASLARLGALLASDNCASPKLAMLIESDMALAAALLKTVNSPLYALSGRIRSVREALTYLGTREVAAAALRIGLRGAFPSSAAMDRLWKRAAVRGSLMGRLAQELAQDAWAAHSAGLFAECGKAVLLRHAGADYGRMLETLPEEAALRQYELDAFGTSHDVLAAALCTEWGVIDAAIHAVRHQVDVYATRVLPLVSDPTISAVTALAQALMRQDGELPEIAAALCSQLRWDEDCVGMVLVRARTWLAERSG